MKLTKKEGKKSATLSISAETDEDAVLLTEIVLRACQKGALTFGTISRAIDQMARERQQESET